MMIKINQDPKTTAVLVSAVRTPIGKFMGGLASLRAPELGSLVIRAALERSGIDPQDLDEAIMGHVIQAGTGQAPARQAAYNGGVPETVPAMTINKVCGSGLKAVMLAAQAIRAGDAQAIVAGGMESMSNAPYLLRGYREGVKFGNQEMVDGLIHDGLWCSFHTCHMGGHAEYTAHKAGISRSEADQFAYESHQKAVQAIEGGKFKEEIVPVEIAGRKGTTVVDTDESPRRDTNMDALGKLRPSFKKDAPQGIEELIVTAGNAPGLNDGASATVVTSEEYARAHGLTIMARITGYAAAGAAPQDLFFAPVRAVEKLMERTGMAIDDYGLIEANEAFAVQALADGKELGWDWDRVNVNGGAVALGHPIGASGARVLTTLLYAMEDRNKETGMATLCLGGGNAVALSVEKV